MPVSSYLEVQRTVRFCIMTYWLQQGLSTKSTVHLTSLEMPALQIRAPDLVFKVPISQ